jgi:hypothetical protein
MLPSEDDVANFIAFAPDAGEGKAFMFLEVRHSDTFGHPEYRALLICALKGADTINEALNQFYENPNKYSQAPVPSMPNPVNDIKETKIQVHSPLPYAPLANTMSEPRRQPHTNAVIKAGNVRARDEVRFTLTSVW